MEIFFAVSGMTGKASLLSISMALKVSEKIADLGGYNHLEFSGDPNVTC